MADWTGRGVPVARLYERMADVELHGESPAYEALCRAVAASPAACALIEGLPAEKRQPNLVLAAVRYLSGPVVDPPAFLDFLRTEWSRVAAVVLARRTQTNEAGRCAVLLPVLASLPQPLALIEVGASAGLCLHPDRYSYAYEPGGRVGTGRPVFPCAVTGPAPLPAAPPEVVYRAGLDLHPLDAADPDDRRWLECLVWPEHADRAARLREALDVAAAAPVTITAGDLLADTEALLAAVPAGATPVLFHSAVLAYLPAADRAAFTGWVRGAGVRWIANEGPRVLPATDGPPGRFVLSLDGRPLAHTGPHGRTLDWLGSVP